MNKIFGEKKCLTYIYTQVHSSELEEVNIYKQATVKEILCEQGFREGDKEGQTVPGPRGLVGVLLKQGIPI